MQQITAVSAAINGGTLYTPYIVKRIVEPETGEIILENNPVSKGEVISKDSSNTVRMALESVVANGSGRNAYIEGYRVGGKTGTAQKVKDGRYMVGNYILSFIGFLPANDPKVVVYVAIDNPKGVVQYGGTTVAPVAKAILEDAITSLGVEKQEGGLEKEYQWYDTKYNTVSNVVGMSLNEAKKSLSSFKVDVEGTGTKVIAMSPEAGSYIPLDSTVRLMMGN